ncbi:MAG TPA: alkaline phosphatase PhoX, partial [Kofleriaceae bacterium]|nr:alkaline phosphatase PhoX [Kofleriaceae bacterium]
LPSSTTQPNRGDRVGGVFAMQETTSATPASSMTFTYWQVWGGSVTPGLYAAGDPDNIVIDKHGGVWFGTDGYFGVSNRKTSDAFYYLDLDPAHKTTPNPTFGLAFRVASVPSDAEATGPAFTPGMTTLFLSVQHPGEDVPSSWPAR